VESGLKGEPLSFSRIDLLLRSQVSLNLTIQVVYFSDSSS